MGKYAIKSANPQDNSNGILIATCLNSIANELAELVEQKKLGNRQLKEANRLKRIEILVKYGGYIFIKRDEMVKELKDRA